MPNVFPWLALGNLIVLGATAFLGLLDSEFAERHVALAVFTLLLSCLVQTVVFTYFVVTGKMIVQAVHLAQLGHEPVEESKTLKRSAVRCLALLLFSVVLVAATGGYRWGARTDDSSHLVSAGLIVTIHLIVLVRQHGFIVRNARMLGAVLAEYEDQRRSKSGRGPSL